MVKEVTASHAQDRHNQEPAAEHVASTSAHEMAKEASRNAPARRRRAPVKQRSRLYKAFHALPDYLKDNEFITTGYRVEYSFWETMRSLFGLHNETGNVWTHLLGFVLFIVLTVVTIRSKPVPLAQASTELRNLENHLLTFGQSSWDSFKHAFWVHSLGQPSMHLMEYGRSSLHELETSVWEYGWEAWHDMSHVEERLLAYGNYPAAAWVVPCRPVYVFTAGAMVCLFTSSVCHLFGCCATHIATVIWRFDYAGIAVLIVCSFFPPVYYGFMCTPHWQLFYLGVSTVLGCATVAISLAEKFQGPNYRPWRAALFAGLGLFGLVPVIHGYLLHLDVLEVHKALSWDMAMGVIYLLGATLYACRFPECLFPGKFDLALNSHQLFHVAVVVAACIHYRAVRVLLAWRDANGGCAGDPALSAAAVHAASGSNLTELFS
eukprot:jgi/Astpho2/7907/e_gw1.00118.28.1_t